MGVKTIEEDTMRIGPFLAIAALALAPAATAADWHPSRHGAADRLGAANYLTAEGAKRAARLVKTGKVYALGIVTGPDTPAYPPRRYSIVVTQSNDGTGAPVAANKVTGNDDLLITYAGVGTQIDGLGHVGIDHRYYNGLHAKDFVRPTGLEALGTETIPPAATRGVLLDMTRLTGKNPVPAGTAFNRAEIDAAAKAAKLKIGKGDVVLFHTGWLALAGKDPKTFIETQPGLGVEGAEYLADLGVVMIGADTSALEAIPFEDATRPFAVHQTLLAKHGVHILENIDTAALAADGATEFMFVLGVPRFKGAVQMVVNPVAVR
jgi:hypothetical protein